jgi:polyferredoxin
MSGIYLNLLRNVQGEKLVRAFKGREIRLFRIPVQLAMLTFLLGCLYGISSFGTSPLLKRFFLPNASCRYIESAPTYCYYYPLQDGLTTGFNVWFIDVILLVLIETVLILLLGRIWCSWICPFGFVQELLSDLRKRLNLPPLRLRWSHRMFLRQVKYAILFFTVLISASIGISALGLTGSQSTFALPFCQVCPAKGFFTVTQQMAGILPLTSILPAIAVLMLLFFLATSFTNRMFWCRVCPMGGFMSLFATHSLTWLHKDADKCTKCRICLRVCPMDHDKVYEHMRTGDVGGEDCTLCGRCIELCPEKDCLSLNFMSRRLITSRRPRFREAGQKTSYGKNTKQRMT